MDYKHENYRDPYAKWIFFSFFGSTFSFFGCRGGGILGMINNQVGNIDSLKNSIKLLVF